MIECLAPALGSGYSNIKIFFNGCLSDKVAKAPRAEARIEISIILNRFA
jgi:hypothetical protein